MTRRGGPQRTDGGEQPPRAEPAEPAERDDADETAERRPPTFVESERERRREQAAAFRRVRRLADAVDRAIHERRGDEPGDAGADADAERATRREVAERAARARRRGRRGAERDRGDDGPGGPRPPRAPAGS